MSSANSSPPLLRELREMVDRLAVVFHGDLDVRFDEVPRLRKISVSDPVSLPDRPALVHVHLVQEVHLLALVDVAGYRCFPRLRCPGRSFSPPPLVPPTPGAVDAPSLGPGVPLPRVRPFP